MNAIELMSDLVRAARAAGADAADALLVSGTSLNVSLRLGKPEQVERSEARDIGLRVFAGKRSAIVSTTSADPGGFRLLAERAMDMARVVPEDPFGGLGEREGPVEGLAELDLADAAAPEAEALIARAGVAEAAALAVRGVTNSEGAEAGYGRTEVALVTSGGFAGTYVRTSHSVSAAALAGTGTGMQRDYDYSSAVHLADLEDAASIGHTAGEKAVTRLNPARPRTARMPVVYDPRVASSLLGHLIGAVSGASVARGTSFLKDRMGQRVFPAGVSVIDDPRRRRGLRSRPFDGEGTPTRALTVIDDGMLATWLLDSRSARQLGLVTTGHASRGTGGPPSPAATNLYLCPGALTPAELMADIKEGLYVTELIGMGVNGLTGDYSRGAAGFMIRDGALAEPVAEITIAGTLPEMFAHLAVANDLRFRRATDSPTVRVDTLTVAGA
jgi:PmbA protein